MEHEAGSETMRKALPFSSIRFYLDVPTLCINSRTNNIIRLGFLVKFCRDRNWWMDKYWIGNWENLHHCKLKALWGTYPTESTIVRFLTTCPHGQVKTTFHCVVASELSDGFTWISTFSSHCLSEMQLSHHCLWAAIPVQAFHLSLKDMRGSEFSTCSSALV